MYVSRIGCVLLHALGFLAVAYDVRGPGDWVCSNQHDTCHVN
jgi:hypothetical protein